MRRIEAYCVSTTIAEFTRDAAAACEEGARSGSQKAAFTHDLKFPRTQTQTAAASR